MNCPQTKSRLIDLLYNELDDPTAASVRRHLESCSRCAAERTALERTRDALDAWTPAESLADSRLPATPAAVRFLSCEPLLGSIDLSAWLPCYCDEYTSDRRGVDPAPDAGCG